MILWVVATVAATVIAVSAREAGFITPKDAVSYMTPFLVWGMVNIAILWHGILN